MKEKALYAVECFLVSWEKRDFDSMHNLCQETWKQRHSVEQLIILFDYPCAFISVDHGDIKQVSPCVFDVPAKIQIGYNPIKIIARAICETEPFKPNKNGTFGVNPVSILRTCGNA